MFWTCVRSRLNSDLRLDLGRSRVDWQSLGAFRWITSCRVLGSLRPACTVIDDSRGHLRTKIDISSWQTTISHCDVGRRLLAWDQPDAVRSDGRLRQRGNVMTTGSPQRISMGSNAIFGLVLWIHRGRKRDDQRSWYLNGWKPRSIFNDSSILATPA